MNDTAKTPSEQPYTVVARRYRPQAFGELIGQDHIAKALCGAITTSRVGHAYLFTGARGVGKTSAARIFAKALNCVEGPSETSCNKCEICQRIAAGDDVDVLEIDGASNRGIDEIRQLRQNAGVRPSRARFKIYIIDEVHMLTREAFNALLKTLEEPPEHVKFIFCTTEANKIPVTILSRCQRFDFAGVPSDAIVTRLQQICEAEGVESEPAALADIARRANGSMRDSQSLLEQLLGSAAQSIKVEDVQSLLGTAGTARVGQLVDHLVDHDAAAALSEFDAAFAEGVDPGQLVTQLIDYLRDAMVLAAGGNEKLMRYAGPEEMNVTTRTAEQFGLETTLAAIAVLDQTLTRMRQSTHVRTLVEIALVRICRLEDLDALGGLIADLKAGKEPSAAKPVRKPSATRAAAPSKKNVEVAPPSPAPEQAHAAADASPNQELSEAAETSSTETVQAEPQAVAENAAEVHAEESVAAVEAPPAVALEPSSASETWKKVVAQLHDEGNLLATHAERSHSVKVDDAGCLVVSFVPQSAFDKSRCEKSDAKSQLEQRLANICGSQVRLRFDTAEGMPAPTAEPKQPSKREQQKQIAEHPMVQRAAELFGAEVVATPRKPK